MAKLTVALKIDVTKIDKNRLFKGAKGTYLDALVFIDTDNPSQYGDNGMITQSVSKEERQQGIRGEILGNCKVLGGQQSQASQQNNPQSYPQAAPQVAPGTDQFDENIPF